MLPNAAWISQWSALGLLLISPLLALLALWIKRDSPGPVFYRGPRVGRGGKTFYILKFRTMYERPASYAGPRLTAKDDPRITPIGHWLRDTKLNELPQLWNVLKGEMSLVGPRPEDPEIAKSWSPEVREELIKVRPGITSPASVLYRDEETMLQGGELMDNYLRAIMPSKHRLDQLYVRHRSFLLDLDSLLWTFLVLLPRVGASPPPENRLFLGPMTRLVRRYISWFAIDTAVTLAAIAAAGLFWRTFGPINVGWPNAIGFTLIFALLYSITNVLLNVNKISWSQASAADAFDLVPALMIATLVILVINGIFLARPMPAGMLVIAAGISAVGYFSVRYRTRIISGLMRRWLNRSGVIGHARERILIVGSGEAGQFLAWWLQSSQSMKAFRVVGFVDDDLFKQDTRIRGLPVLGQREQISDLVARHDAGIILFAIHNILSWDRDRLMDLCLATGAQVIQAPDVLGSLNSILHKDVAYPAAHGQTIEMNWCGNPQHVKNAPGAGQMEDWIAELDDLAQNGDLQSLRVRINDIRSFLQASAD